MGPAGNRFIFRTLLTLLRLVGPPDEVLPFLIKKRTGLPPWAFCPLEVLISLPFSLRPSLYSLKRTMSGKAVNSPILPPSSVKRVSLEGIRVTGRKVPLHLPPR